MPIKKKVIFSTLCVCVCMRERERDRDSSIHEKYSKILSVLISNRLKIGKATN